MPVWLYHKDHPEGRIFEDDEVRDALKQGWSDAPGNVEIEEISDAPPTKEELIGIAQQLGVKVDRRWGIERIRQAIEDAEGLLDEDDEDEDE